MQDKHTQKIVLNKLKLFIKDNDIDLNVRVLDIGCSDIRLYSQYLIDNAALYVGIDKNEGSIFKAKEKNIKDNVKFYIVNSEEITNLKETYDLVIINNALAYTDKPKVIKNIFQILENNGSCISLYNNTYMYNIYKIFYPIRNVFIEFIHSSVVLINTILYRIFSIRLFHTTSNNFFEIKSLLNKYKFKRKIIIRDKESFSWETIHFIFKK